MDTEPKQQAGNRQEKRAAVPLTELPDDLNVW
jgi:hypothetical protein